MNETNARKEDSKMRLEMEPIGYVEHDSEEIPRSWKVSDVKGAGHD